MYTWQSVKVSQIQNLSDHLFIWPSAHWIVSWCVVLVKSGFSFAMWSRLLLKAASNWSNKSLYYFERFFTIKIVDVNYSANIPKNSGRFLHFCTLQCTSTLWCVWWMWVSSTVKNVLHARSDAMFSYLTQFKFLVSGHEKVDIFDHSNSSWPTYVKKN